MDSSQLALYESSGPALLQLLREELQDDDYMRRAFTLLVQDDRARSATAEIRNGQLRITVVGGSIRDLTIDLAGVDTDTLGGLVDYLRRQTGYCISENEELETSHAATDLRIKGHGKLNAGGLHFYHRRWSDFELRRLLERAARRHNLNYDVDTVPTPEHGFIVTLAAAASCRTMAQDGVKRRDLSFEVQDCLEMAKSYDRQYTDDRRRQNRAVPVAKVKDSNIEGGDIVQGSFFRRNLRTGHLNIAAQKSPEVPEIFISGEEDVQDTQIRVNWRRIRDTDFYAMELWRDTQRDVRRTHLGNTTFAPTSTVERPIFPTSSKLVYAPNWVGSRYVNATIGTYGRTHNQVVNSYVDGIEDRDDFFQEAYWEAPPPEPNTTYYYRLYVFDVNHEAVGSEVLEVQTRRMRARFPRNTDPPPAETALEPTTGPMAGGTACTVRGVRFHEGMRVKVGDKLAENLVIVSAEEATFDTPEVFNPQIAEIGGVDVVIISDTGLEDALFQAWRYTLT